LTMQVASCHRSRSPAGTGRYSKSRLPEVKTWVLVIAETNPKKRLWKNAIPGLVSKVTQSHSIDNSQLDTRVNVLIPNLFGLRYGFTGPRYAELRDLKLSDIRVYKGHDSAKLKDALVKAVQEAARKRISVRASESMPKKELDETLELPALRSFAGEGIGASEKASDELGHKANELVQPSHLQDSRNLFMSQCSEERHVAESAMGDSAQVCFSSLSAEASPSQKRLQSPRPVERDTTQGNIDALFTATSPLRLSQGKSMQPSQSQSVERHTTHANIAALFNGGDVVILDNAEIVKAIGVEAAPTTPLVTQRNLMRNDTPIDSEFQVPLSKSCMRCDAEVSQEKPNFFEITAAVSKAFVDAEEAVLSKQSLEFAVAKSSLRISSESFIEALVQLDKMNKIMLSDELVFLV